MRRVPWIIFSLIFLLWVTGCSLNNSPKRLSTYLAPENGLSQGSPILGSLSDGEISGILVLVNDTDFQGSAPSLREETLAHLGESLQSEIQEQLPVQLNTVVIPENFTANQSADQLIQLAQEHDIPFLLLAVLSGTEVEVPDRLPLGGFQQGGLRGNGVLGYRAENYARVELALLDGQTGRPIVMTDGQAWAVLERLAVPLESNVYPVVRRALTQPPIYPKSDGVAFETLRWVSGQDAIDQAVMHFEEEWRKSQAS